MHPAVHSVWCGEYAADAFVWVQSDVLVTVDRDDINADGTAAARMDPCFRLCPRVWPNHNAARPHGSSVAVSDFNCQEQPVFRVLRNSFENQKGRLRRPFSLLWTRQTVVSMSVS